VGGGGKHEETVAYEDRSTSFRPRGIALQKM